MPYEARVAPEVQPSIDIPLAVTPQASGAGVADAVERLGDVATDIHLKEIEHANRVNVLDADNQQQAFLQARLYDPKTGILNQQLGKDAPVAVDQALSEYDESAARVESGLTNEAQKAHFRQMVGERRLQMQDQLGRYEHAETERYADEVAKGSIIAATNTAVQNASDPRVVDDNVALIHAVLDHQGQSKGRAPELTEALQKEAASQVYTSAIGSLVDAGDTAGAKRSFDQWGDDLTPADKSQVRGLLKTSTTRGESREMADTIIGSQGTDGDLQGALEDLEKRKIDNAEVYDQTRNRLVEHFRLVNEAENQRQAGLYDDATGYIDAAANPTSPDIVPPTVWDRMKPAYKRKAMTYASARAKGQEPETPKALFAALEQQKAQDPQAFAKRNLLLLPLSKEDFRKYAADQAGIAKGDAKLVAKFETDGQVISQVMLQGGMKPAKSGKKQGDDEVNFRDQLAKAVTAEQQSTGKEVGQARLGEIGRTLMQATVLKRGTSFLSYVDDVLPFGFLLPERESVDTVHAFQHPVAQKIAYSFDQIPAPAAAKHRAALEVYFPAKSVTDEMVRQRYNEDLVEAYRDGE